METVSALVLLILFCLISVWQNLKDLDEKYVFSEAKLESSVSSFKNIEKQPRIEEYFSNTEMYKVGGVELKIGDYLLDDIVYWFYKGKLLTIELTVSKGYSNQQGVLKVLEAA